jgi:imidazolonepropionase-like amidohydrolase
MVTTVIKAGLLIDGRGNCARNQAITIKGRFITAIDSLDGFVPEPGARVLDAGSYVVMPGLVDCHVHVRSSGNPSDRSFDSTQTTIPQFTLRALQNAQKDLEAGFTTIRDLGRIGYLDVALRDAFEKGEFRGPRMRVAGCGLTMWGGHMHRFMRPGLDMVESTGVVNNPGEAQSAARYQIGRGVDFVKFNTAVSDLREDGKHVSQEMDYDMLVPAVREAKKVGVGTATHCHGGQGATDAILAGVDTIEHGHWLTDEHFELMLKRGTVFVPTLCPNEKLYEMGPEGAGRAFDRWRWLERVMEDKTDTLLRALEAGVPIAAGSDAGTNYNRHGENAREMEFLVRRCMTPMQAIVAATRTAAQATRLDHKTGTLEPGKWADILVVKEDPLQDITVLNKKENIVLVMKDGQVMVERGPGLYASAQ